MFWQILLPRQVLELLLQLQHQSCHVAPALWLLRLKPDASNENSRLSIEELRSLVLESGNFIPQQHRDILLNLFELEQLTVADIMTPRGEIEAIDITAPLEDIKQQLATSFHTRVAVYQNDPANIIGIVHQRRLLAEAFAITLETQGGNATPTMDKMYVIAKVI